MANVASKLSPFKATFKVGSDTYTSHVSDANYAPTAPTSEVTDIGGTTHRFSGDSAWVLNVTVFQDWSATGLATWLLAHEGETAAVELATPQAVFASTVTIVAPAIGGPANAVATAAVAMPSTKPVRTVVAV